MITRPLLARGGDPLGIVEEKEILLYELEVYAQLGIRPGKQKYSIDHYIPARRLDLVIIKKKKKKKKERK